MEIILVVLFVTILVIYSLQRYARDQTAQSSTPGGEKQISQIKERLAILDPSFANIPIYIDDSAYTINKKTMYLCLTDPSGNTYDINTLMYVTLHELAHIITKELEYDSEGKVLEHGPKFKANFYTLIELATAKGVYDSAKPMPSSYCNVVGTSLSPHSSRKF